MSGTDPAITPDKSEIMKSIPFSCPDYGADEIENLKQVVTSGQLEGGGIFTQDCEVKLEALTGSQRTMIVPSCTAALEMMALAMTLMPGDEVIMPSYTFVSTANAMALRGGVPVFVDIEPTTLNIDPSVIEAAITPRTKALMIVHYAGVACDMDAILDICRRHDLTLLEDAAQALNASWKGQPLGSLGRFGAISFHHTKNVTCGEGGVLLINNPEDIHPCEMIREKGTDRTDFLRGQISKYEWQVLGSSFLLGELAAAVLSAQLTRSVDLKKARMKNWLRYDRVFSDIDTVRTPHIPAYADHNAHIYHIRLPNTHIAQTLRRHCADCGVTLAPHYVPLHNTPGGVRFGRYSGHMTHTLDAAETLLRLPIHADMTKTRQDMIIDLVANFVDHM